MWKFLTVDVKKLLTSLIYYTSKEFFKYIFIPQTIIWRTKSSFFIEKGQNKKSQNRVILYEKANLIIHIRSVYLAWEKLVDK